MRALILLPWLPLLVACGGAGPGPDSGSLGESGDTGERRVDTSGEVIGDAFADALVSFTPGEGAGFGQDALPDVVLGPPEGLGERMGSTDVLSLGAEGEVVLRFDEPIVDGEGADLIVFENPFVAWIETGFVAASADGESFREWPCDPDDAEGGYPGCAGVRPVYANSTNGIDPTDPEAAGGDPFDLAEIGLAEASWIRIRDSGRNAYASPTGGFDLDALAVVGSATPRRTPPRGQVSNSRMNW